MMALIVVLAILLLSGCDDLSDSGGNTGAYWYMRGWRGTKPPTPEEYLYQEAQEERLKTYLEMEGGIDVSNVH